MCVVFTATGLPFASCLSGAVSRDSDPGTRCSGFTSLHGKVSLGIPTEMTIAPSLISSLDLSHCEASWSLQVFKTFTTQETHTQYELWLPTRDPALVTSELQLVCGDPEEIKISPAGQWFILDHQWFLDPRLPESVVLVKNRFSFIGTGVFLSIEVLSFQLGRHHWLLFQVYHMNGLFGTLKFPSEISQTTSVLSELSSRFPQLLIKLWTFDDFSSSKFQNPHNPSITTPSLCHNSLLSGANFCFHKETWGGIFFIWFILPDNHSPSLKIAKVGTQDRQEFGGSS